MRVIAATNRDLGRGGEGRTFREDLYYRLNVVTIDRAPLRERAGGHPDLDDVRNLVFHFLDKHRFKRAARRPGSPRRPWRRCSGHDFPGNVRELEGAGGGGGGSPT